MFPSIFEILIFLLFPIRVFFHVEMSACVRLSDFSFIRILQLFEHSSEYKCMFEVRKAN